MITTSPTSHSASNPFLRTSEIALRVIADFLIVHASAMAALLFVAFRLEDTPTQSIVNGLATLRAYYLNSFLPLSLIFPAVYATFGMYTRLRSYSMGHKVRRAAQSAFTGCLVLLFLNFLTTRSNALPRTSMLVFAGLVLLATPGVRWLQYLLFQWDREATAPEASAEPAEGPILVVGGAGYIGAVLVRKLLARGAKVRLLDSLVYGDAAVAEILDDPNLEFMQGDCRNIQDVVKAMTGASSVVHLAAVVGDPACEQDKQNALEINYSATRMMVEIAKGHGIGRFVFASSCSVYGASEFLMDEQSKTEPVSLYGKTKIDSERVLLDAQSPTFHPIVLRFATVFGLAPRPRFDLVVNLLTAKARQEGVITIYNGEQWRPFIHVDDIAQAIVETLYAPIQSVSGEIFNVGDDRLNFTLGQIAEKIREHFPDTQIQEVENSDRRNYRVSFAKIRNQIGFTCERTLDDGIREISAAFDRGTIADYQEAFYSNVKFLRLMGALNSKDETTMQVMAALSHTPSAPAAILH
ncbi:MAG TPA: NAD-dependent epimerase/dehydratase family protein [Bryobacteraceae bacterium]|jgi:nucleoside-diphosphate-sugar epimerase